MSEEIIDLKDVLERVQDDRELLLELLDIYQEDFVSKRQALEVAIIAKDIVKIKEIAHSMKGSSGNISAKPLYAECLKLELLAKEGKVDEMPAMLPTIDVMFIRIQDYAIQLKKDFSA